MAVDIAVDDVPADQARFNLSCRALASLMLLGIVSFAAVSDQSREEPPKCGPFTLDRSALGGCDWLG
jgi:hypothetical protein